MIKGFIFDLDGVVVFTDRLHYRAWKMIADRLGTVFNEEINNRLRGVSRMESLEIILEKYQDKILSQEEKEELASAKNDYYCKLLKTMKPSDVPDEVRGTLDRLRDKGFRLAIGSSSKNAKKILMQVGLTEVFDAVSDGTNISRAKPDPEVFLKAAEYLHLKAEDCAVIEDAKAGIDAAKAGGMIAIAVGDARYYDRADISLEVFSDLVRIQN